MLVLVNETSCLLYSGVSRVRWSQQPSAVTPTAVERECGSPRVADPLNRLVSPPPCLTLYSARAMIFLPLYCCFRTLRSFPGSLAPPLSLPCLVFGVGSGSASVSASCPRGEKFATRQPTAHPPPPPPLSPHHPNKCVAPSAYKLSKLDPAGN